MFKALRSAVDTLRAIERALDELARTIHAVPTSPPLPDGLAERVAVLESTLDLSIAEANGLLIKAGSLKAAARASEERERKLAATKQESEDSLGGEFTPQEIAEAYSAAGFQPPDANGGVQPELPGLPEPVEGSPGGRTGALAKKWGV